MTHKTNFRIGEIVQISLVNLAFILSLATVHTLSAATLKPGDIVVGVNFGTASNQDFGLVQINPVTGNRTVISDDSTGAGPSFDFASAAANGVISYVSYQSDGSLLVVDTATSGSTPKSQLIRVDPATGNRTVVSDFQLNSGPGSGLDYFSGRDFGDNILVGGPGGLLTVDPATGNRSLFPAGGGSGPQPRAVGFAIDGTNVYVADNGMIPRILQADSVTGIRTVVSGAGVGSGPALTIPADVALDSTGNLLVMEINTLLRIDPATGNRTIISGSGVGFGPTMESSTLGVTSTGAAIVVTGFGLYQNPGQVLSVDPITGNRTVLSSPLVGTGPSFYDAGGILVVPNVPEPSTAILATIGVLGLLACHSRLAPGASKSETLLSAGAGSAPS